MAEANEKRVESVHELKVGNEYLASRGGLLYDPGQFTLPARPAPSKIPQA